MLLRLFVLIALVLLTSALPAGAQTATPTSLLLWDQGAGTLADAQTLTYEAQFDAAPVVVLTATCTGATSPYSCSAAFPALTPTTHTVRLRAVSVVGGTRMESPMSAVFTFTFVALPSAPANLRIGSGL